jgi:hypothetical protein
VFQSRITFSTEEACNILLYFGIQLEIALLRMHQLGPGKTLHLHMKAPETGAIASFASRYGIKKSLRM